MILCESTATACAFSEGHCNLGLTILKSYIPKLNIALEERPTFSGSCVSTRIIDIFD